MDIATDFEIHLPQAPYSPVSKTPTFMWGSYNSSDFLTTIDEVYREAIQWKPHLFKVPKGTAGKAFVSELARMYTAFGSKSTPEIISLKAAVLLPDNQMPGNQTQGTQRRMLQATQRQVSHSRTYLEQLLPNYVGKRQLYSCFSGWS